VSAATTTRPPRRPGLGTIGRGLALAVLLAVSTACAATPPSAEAPAPPAAGPALSVPTSTLDAALTCTPGVGGAAAETVLLVPATTLTAQEAFSWNWQRLLGDAGRPVCTVDLPDRALGDMQLSAEYVVHAVRAVHGMSGHPVDVIGHSQGGVLARFAVRFWPDARPMVDDLIGLGAPNHGSTLNDCTPSPGCAPAIWQLKSGSRILQALNTPAETFPGVSSTNVYSWTDDTVQPNTDDGGTSSLQGPGASNVAVQELCPASTAGHLALGTTDPVAAAVVLDALEHPGPADPLRIDPDVCQVPAMAGADPATVAADLERLNAVIVEQITAYPAVASEPALLEWAGR
jgi:hypothetical protein